MNNLNHYPRPVYRVDRGEIVLLAEINIFENLFDWNVKVVRCPIHCQDKIYNINITNNTCTLSLNKCTLPLNTLYINYKCM